MRYVLSAVLLAVRMHRWYLGKNTKQHIYIMLECRLMNDMSRFFCQFYLLFYRSNYGYCRMYRFTMTYDENGLQNSKHILFSIIAFEIYVDE